MIWESEDWKEPLLKTANWLSNFKVRPGTRESSFVKLEKEVMIGFYATRKLIDKTCATKYSLLWYPNLKPVDFLNWHHIDELYDLTSAGTHRRDVAFICNQFIHSFVFMPKVSSRFDGIYIASDRIRRDRLYYVPMKTIVEIFRTVGRDYPYSSKTIMNRETGERTAIDVE